MKSKLSSMLLSIAIAFGLWTYVITSVSPGSEETYSQIPVILDGEALLAERNLMITSASASSATRMERSFSAIFSFCFVTSAASHTLRPAASANSFAFRMTSSHVDISRTPSLEFMFTVLFIECGNRILTHQHLVQTRIIFIREFIVEDTLQIVRPGLL